MSESLKATTVRNVGYNSLAKIIQMAVMAVANVILTRTLAPSDYGIVGFAVIFTAFLNQFSDLGISSAAVRKKDLDSHELYTAFTIKFVIGLVIFILAFLGAPLALYFFENPAIVGVIRVLAFNFVLNTFGILPTILLTRSLEYKKIAFANLLSAIINSLVAVTLAMLGFKYWSLVIAVIVMTFSTVILMNLFRPTPYRFAFDSDTAHDYIRFGGNIFIAGFITFLIFNSDNFIIGAVKGATILGYYSLAFNWGSMACTMISGIVLSVLLPAYSRMQDDRERLKNSYLKVLQVVSFGGVLLNMTLFVVSRDFLFLVLGHSSDKWLPALTTLRILCFYGIARLLLEPVGQVLMALGRTEVLRKATILVAVVELIGLYPAIHYLGIEGAAALVTLAYLTQYVVYFQVLKSELQIDIGVLCSTVSPSFWGMLAVCPVFLLGEIGGGASILSFIVKVALCVILYLATYGLSTKFHFFQEIRSIAGRLV